jgi:hypothetical protein
VTRTLVARSERRTRSGAVVQEITVVWAGCCDGCTFRVYASPDSYSRLARHVAATGHTARFDSTTQGVLRPAAKRT